MTNNISKETKQLVKALAKMAYPDYNGRKFSVEVTRSYYLSNYWDGGSRNYCVAVDLSTGKIVDPSEESKNPFTNSAHTCVVVPQGVGILEHSFYCGKDMGIRLYVAAPLAIEAANTKQIEA